MVRPSVHPPKHILDVERCCLHGKLLPSVQAGPQQPLKFKVRCHKNLKIDVILIKCKFDHSTELN